MARRTRQAKRDTVKHFAAFFATKSRQNDYLWGRLDGVELILRLLADVGLRQQETTLATVGGDEKPPPPYTAEALDAMLARRPTWTSSRTCATT
jgi:Protein of unknown function (DUF3376)